MISVFPALRRSKLMRHIDGRWLQINLERVDGFKYPRFGISFQRRHPLDPLATLWLIQPINYAQSVTHWWFVYPPNAEVKTKFIHEAAVV